MIEFELTKSQSQMKAMLQEFSRNIVRPLSLKADEDHRIPDDFLMRFSQMKAMMGGEVPTEYGGTEKAVVDVKKASQKNRFALVGAEELAWGDASVLLSLPGPGLGGPPVQFTGTPEQKERFLGIFKAPNELHYGAYGLTEPGAGSDVSAIRTSCRLEGDTWVLNGRKCYITNGGKADWVVIFATLDPAQGRAGHRAFVVEKGTPGFSVGKIEEKMGLRASETAELVLEDCRVPMANLLGGAAHYEGKANSEGFKAAMKTFDSTRPMVGIMAVGIARAAFESTRDFVRENYMLGRPIARYAILADKLAEAARTIDAARLLCWHAAYLADEGKPNAKEASMAKAYAASIAMRVCAEAVQILGAAGLEKSRFVEKWYRDIKVFDIFEGTAQIQRVVISKRILRAQPTF